MKFSVLLPTRNRLDLLGYAVETVRRQDYDNWEVIISDNHSDQDIAGFVRSLNDDRLRYVRTETFIPVTDNWNNALEKASGDYVIMLGDDDCLMKGYFSKMSRLLKEFDAPDVVYTSAFLYTYPGVLPGKPDGGLRSYVRRKIFQSTHEAFLLKKEDAIEFVNDALNFRVTFDYNMQFFLISRKLVEAMKPYGPFFQSPYPDYYASNALLLKASRILVMPLPMVTIGISPKSFGFFYFNDAESDGNEFLNNLPDQTIVRRLQSVILPGTVMNTSWLISMQTLMDNFAREFPIKVNYARYRLIQIFSLYAASIMNRDSSRKADELLSKKMRLSEWLRYGVALSIVARIAPKRYRPYLAEKVLVVSGSHPAAYMPPVEGKFTTILDVYDQVDPEKHGVSPRRSP